MTRHHRGVVLAGLLLAALNMRIGLVQVGPVIDDIRADTGMSGALAGLLGTIPFLCFGLFAFGGPPLIRVIGTSRTVAAALGLIGVGTVGRAALEPPLLMLVATVPMSVGVAVLGVALPAVIKHRFADHAAGLTGAYIAAMSVGAIAVAALTVPLADALGGWRWALALPAVLAIVALPSWLGRLAPAEPTAQGGAPRSRRPSRQALLLALTFGLQSTVFAAMINWIAALYIAAGWPDSRAALAAASIPVFTLLMAIAVPVLTTRATRPAWIAGAGLTAAVGLAGMAVAPTALAVLWIPLAGLGMSAIFPLVMTLPLDLREDAGGVADLTAWMLGLGYLVGATGPVLVGALRDVTDGFTLPVLLVAAAGAAAGVLGFRTATRTG